jgi:hypothetical protein
LIHVLLQQDLSSADRACVVVLDADALVMLHSRT